MAGGIETRKVALLGWYGHRNFGDELMLEGLRNLFRGWEVVALNGDNGMLDFDLINSCDLFVLGGGELIHSNRLYMPTPSKHKFQHGSLAYRLYARSPFGRRCWLHNIKVPKIVLGCGVNVEKASDLNRNVIKDLEQFSYIGLRDNVAISILRSFPQLADKVHLFNDLAFAINADGLVRHHNEDLAVAVPTDRFTFGDRGVQERNVAAKSEHWLKNKLSSYAKTVFLAFGSEDNDDYGTCKSLVHCARNSVIYRATELSLPEILGLFCGCKAVFTYRLHGLILAHIADVEYEFYPYHRKLQRVHKTIAHHNYEEIKFIQRSCFETIINRMEVEKNV